MNPKFLITIYLLLIGGPVSCQEIKGSASSQPPESVVREEAYQSKDFIRTNTGAIIDVKGAAKAEAEYKAMLEAHGQKWRPTEPGIPGSVEEYFTIPKDEELMNCTYVQGYSFPDICDDGNGKIIFNATKDDQKVLDQIIKKQGKQGKYNKMPNGGPLKIEGVEPK